MNIQKAGLRIADLLSGINLVDADQALDDARKVLWGAVFENRHGGEVADAFGVSDLVCSIARELEGLNFEDANKVIRRVRFIVWRVTYEERRDVSGGAPRHPGDTEPASLH